MTNQERLQENNDKIETIQQTLVNKIAGNTAELEGRITALENKDIEIEGNITTLNSSVDTINTSLDEVMETINNLPTGSALKTLTLENVSISNLFNKVKELDYKLIKLTINNSYATNNIIRLVIGVDGVTKGASSADHIVSVSTVFTPIQKTSNTWRFIGGYGGKYITMTLDTSLKFDGFYTYIDSDKIGVTVSTYSVNDTISATLYYVE